MDRRCSAEPSSIREVVPSTTRRLGVAWVSRVKMFVADVQNLTGQREPLIQFKRLGPVQSDAKFTNLPFFRRTPDGGPRHYFYMNQSGTTPNLPQHRKAVVLRQMQVQHHHARLGFVVSATLFTKRHRFLAVTENLEIVFSPVLIQRVTEEVHITGVVFDQN